MRKLRSLLTHAWWQRVGIGAVDQARKLWLETRGTPDSTSDKSPVPAQYDFVANWLFSVPQSVSSTHTVGWLSPFLRSLHRITASGSTDLPNQHARLPQQILQLPAFLKGFSRIMSMLERVFIAQRSARSWRTTMHPAASFPAHRRRHARFPRTRSGPAARARQHWADITPRILRHLFAGGGAEPARAPACH
jgi:hypothetical protein